MKYFVDGNDPTQYGSYSAWRVVDENGAIMSTFFGPMSRVAAISFCRDINNNTLPYVADFTYDLPDSES